MKVPYAIGTLKPALIQPYVSDFVRLLESKNNRLVWGAMTALGSVAPIAADEVGKHADAVMRATEKGSVITQDWGVRVLALVAGEAGKAQETHILPYLINFLKTCPAKKCPATCGEHCSGRKRREQGGRVAGIARSHGGAKAGAGETSGENTARSY